MQFAQRIDINAFFFRALRAFVVNVHFPGEADITQT
jgi:hypothetical protein